jgi:hypothetical protein
MALLYTEAQKISDVLGANLVPLPTRTVKVTSGQGALGPGSVMVGGTDDVFHLIRVADGVTQPQVGILGEWIGTGTVADPLVTPTATLFFGGEFRESRLVVFEETTPVDLFAIREYLLRHNIYLASSGRGQ